LLVVSHENTVEFDCTGIPLGNFVGIQFSSHRVETGILNYILEASAINYDMYDRQFFECLFITVGCILSVLSHIFKGHDCRRQQLYIIGCIVLEPLPGNLLSIT
jgi:hypothetical protein